MRKLYGAVQEGDGARPVMADLAQALWPLRPKSGAFIVGVTGSVAAGKSVFAGELAGTLAGLEHARDVEVICTDGFLLPNAVLDARGLTLRKGFPESFDDAALGAALSKVRFGPVVFPGYSHVTYDVEPGLARRVGPVDVLIIEGLGLGPHRSAIDALIYLDADEAYLEAWFVERFMGLWTAAADDPASFYARFRAMDQAEAATFARSVWTAINLPNLRQHIFPQRNLADLVVQKGPDHEIVWVLGGHGQGALL